MDAIRTDRLTKRFDSTVAVNNLDLNVKSGTFYGLLGPNGCGKTTTVRLLSGQIRPTSGKSSVLGVDSRNYITVRKNMGLVPEEEYPPSFLTPLEYLKFVCKVREVKNADDRLAFWFDYLDFKNYENVLVKDLSRGTKQKLMLAQAFIHEPSIVFMDEPFINIDPIVQERFKKFLRGYVKRGNTVLFCTHLMPLVEELCDKVGLMKGGSLAKEVPPRNAKREFFKVFKH